MQLLKPLAIKHVGLSPRNVFEVTGVDQLDLEAPLFQKLEERNPVDSGGLRGDGAHATTFEPVGQGAKLTREGAEMTYVSSFGVSTRGNGHIVLLGADVDARSIEIDMLELRRYRNLRTPRFLPPTTAGFGLPPGVLRMRKVDE